MSGNNSLISLVFASLQLATALCYAKRDRCKIAEGPFNLTATHCIRWRTGDSATDE